MPLNPTDWTFKWSVHSNDKKTPYFLSCSSLSLDEFNSNTGKSLSMSSLMWSGCVCSCVLSVPAMDRCGFSVTAQCSVILLPARDLQTADAWHNPADAEHTVVSLRSHITQLAVCAWWEGCAVCPLAHLVCFNYSKPLVPLQRITTLLWSCSALWPTQTVSCIKPKPCL